MHISVTKLCIVGNGTGALWDLWIKSWSGDTSGPFQYKDHLFIHIEYMYMDKTDMKPS